ncbi:MAG: rod shape-determining protein MreC [Bacteroidetes bacterium GWF2_38_335]|nr:MAG: rod shape-determining protein MreC [Bacteroidetes bacterium GWF2_38_335]OFY77434.1 MAG: rod shape-determining protein MreC [Bacteroidetes bacterium RIFOXYA12_FULL_38_20]HBS87277.1 rod shape-determining protein MreC [Bacteroidales bacterium]
MKSLVRFIIRYHFVFLFLILEIAAFSLVVTYNKDQRESFANSSSYVSGVIYDAYSSITEYFSLKEENRELARENALLHNAMKDSYYFNEEFFKKVNDSVYLQQYEYMNVRVINNSVNKKYNYITINKGRLHGVYPDMALVSPAGIAGIIVNSSDHFATAISVLNSNFKVSALHKKTNYFGSLVWEATGSNTATLYEIPSHVKLEVGDTIVTSGFSSIFPQGTMIGVISSFEKKMSESFFIVEVKLATNFSNLSQMYVVKNLMKKEQVELEKLTEHD